jgi:hypothetical protein
VGLELGLQLTPLLVVLVVVLEMGLELKEQELAAKAFQAGLVSVVAVGLLRLALMVTEEVQGE